MLRVERGQDIDAWIERRHQLWVHLSLLFLLLVHHFHHIPIHSGHDAHLGQLPPLGDAGVDLDGSSRREQIARFLEMAFAQRLRVIGGDVAPLDLVLVLRESWPSGEARGISVVGCPCFKKRNPVLMEQDQDGISSPEQAMPGSSPGA